MVSFLPWFEHCFLQPLYKSGLSFSTDFHLKNISTPVLILHAKDDKVVPYCYAEKVKCHCVPKAFKGLEIEV